MKYLFDTDHITIWMHGASPEYTALAARVAHTMPGDVAYSIVSFHEQLLGANAYFNRRHTIANVVHGYGLMWRLFANYRTATVFPSTPRPE